VRIARPRMARSQLKARRRIQRGQESFAVQRARRAECRNRGPRE
jgi:hypothetical protein